MILRNQKLLKLINTLIPKKNSKINAVYKNYQMSLILIKIQKIRKKR